MKGTRQKCYEVVMMTAHSSIKDSIAAVKMGADDYLVKPFSPANSQKILHY